METEWGQVPDDRVGVITADVTLTGAGAQPREKGSLRVTGGSVLNVLPAMQETAVPFLGWEDAPEKGKATHSSTLGLPLWLSW